MFLPIASTGVVFVFVGIAAIYVELGRSSKLLVIFF